MFKQKTAEMRLATIGAIHNFDGPFNADDVERHVVMSGFDVGFVGRILIDNILVGAVRAKLVTLSVIRFGTRKLDSYERVPL